MSCRATVRPPIHEMRLMPIARKQRKAFGKSCGARQVERAVELRTRPVVADRDCILRGIVDLGRERRDRRTSRLTFFPYNVFAELPL